MIRKLLFVGILALTSIQPFEASAGVSYNYPVYVWTSGSYRGADGNLLDTRMSSDSKSYIGCRISGGWGSSYVYCSARDASGKFASCISYESDPGFANILRAVTNVGEESYVIFDTASDGTTCGNVSVYNYSYSVQ